MIKSLHLSNWFYAAILLGIFSFIIKLSGLDWGFPATLHNDESNVVRSALGMRFGDLNPHHFDWPSLYFYINYFIFAGFLKLRVALQLLFSTDTMQNTFPFWWGPDLPFYYITRILSSIFLSLNIVLVYILSREYGISQKFSFLAATVFSAGYLSNYFSFFGIADTALAFFTALTAYFCIKILKTGSYQDYIFAGIFAGLTTSIKYSGVIMCLLIFIAHIMNLKKFNVFSKKLFLAAFASIALFFAGTPYAILDWETFTRTDTAHGALWQLEHMGRGLNWKYHLFETTPENFGWVGALIGFYAIYLVIKSKNRNTLYLVITYFALLTYIGSWGITREHYSLPIFPFFAVIIGAGFSFISKHLGKNIVYVIIACVLIPQVLSTSKEIIKRNNVDTRITSGIWINENIPKDSLILSLYERTGYFGGAIPVFEYDEYQVYKIGGDREIPENYDTYYLIKINNQNIPGYEDKNQKLEYEVNNDFTTGANIQIYKIEESN